MFRPIILSTMLTLTTCATAYAIAKAPQAIQSAVASQNGVEGFYEIGTCYAFIPRIDAVIVGEVIQLTNEEIVFKTYGRIWPSENPPSTEMAQVKQKMQAIDAYMIASTEERQKMLNGNPHHPHVVSYSRANLTAIKIGKCD